MKYYISNLAEPDDITPIKTIGNLTDGDVIPFGTDNLFPSDLAQLYRSSKIHRATINNKINYYTGKKYISEEYQELIDNVNNNNENLIVLTSKLTKDYALTGNGYIQIVTDKNRSFVHFYHLDSTKVRLEKSKKNILISPDWKRYYNGSQVESLPLFPNFVEDGMLLKSAFHLKDYEPEFSNYGIPDYIAGRDEMTIDSKTSKFNLSKIVNFFGGNKIVFFPVKSDEEAKDFVNNLKSNHIGEGKNGKVMYQPYEAGTNINNAVDKVQVVDVGSNDKGGWVEIAAKAKNDIIMAHNWYRSLMSTGDNTGFDTDRVYQEYQAALPQITGYQDKIINMYEMIYRHIIGIDLSLVIFNKPPIDTDVNSEDLLFLWEMRRDKGLDFDANDPNQQITVGEWKNKIKTL